MKHKIFALLFILLLFSELNGNVVFPGAYIEEIYFDGDYWTIELLNVFVQEETLDSCKIASSSDTSLFNPGIYFPLFGYTLITQDSLQSQFNINKNGDMIATYYLSEHSMSWGEIDQCYFGNYPNSVINPPYSNQSLARITLYNWWPEYINILTKDNSPTLGIPNDTTGTQGTFCGHVFDNQNNPIQGAEIQFYRPYLQSFFPIIITDSTGYFSQQMYSLNFETSILVYESVLLETSITIEPDSTTYCEFYINLTSIDEEIEQYNQIILSNYPNPFIESTRISFNLATDPQLNWGHKNPRITIYNIKGQLVKQFKRQKVKGKNIEVVWNGKNESDVLQPPGFYFYSLEVDGNRIKTNKMIMVR